MTSFEVVLAAINGQPQTRTPYTLTLSLYGARLIGCPLTEYYRNPEWYAEGQEAVRELCSPDILFTPFALTLEAEAFGSELIFFPTNPPNVRKPVVRTADGFLGLSLPDIHSHPSLVYLRESTRRLTLQFKGQVPICGVITAPVDLPAIIMGIDAWIETLLFDPESARRILERTNRHFIDLARALFGDGADFIAMTIVFTSTEILFKKQIDELILPALSQSFQEVGGPIVLHHGGNRIIPLLDDFKTLPNVAAFALDNRDSFSRAREILGPNIPLLGHLNGPTLAKNSLPAILNKVDRILEDRKADPRFILATAGADVPFNTPPGYLAAIAEKTRLFRKVL